MKKKSKKKLSGSCASTKSRAISVIDLFCGAGGLTHGLVLEGLKVNTGIDLDPACRFPYEANNKGARFLEKDIADIDSDEMKSLFTPGTLKVLAGCAPCQPFSTYSQMHDHSQDRKWTLLYEFSRLVRGVLPDVVTMENVPSVEKHQVFTDFVAELKSLDYDVWHQSVKCMDYGVPQTRKRLVLLASRHGLIKLADPNKKTVRTVYDAIGSIEPIKAGESSKKDRLHLAASLSDLNLARIRASRPGGSWRDWPEKLIAKCHKRASGRTYPSVYGRMEWDKPSPTLTTLCYGFGNGRFGHPEQDRAISLREAALLQSFPKSYKFVPDDSPVEVRKIGRLLGNAVPVNLGRAIGKSIVGHLNRLN
jgi:DNA (cytosine-5)-methyltransferase 1